MSAEEDVDPRVKWALKYFDSNGIEETNVSFILFSYIQHSLDTPTKVALKNMYLHNSSVTSVLL